VELGYRRQRGWPPYRDDLIIVDVTLHTRRSMIRNDVMTKRAWRLWRDTVVIVDVTVDTTSLHLTLDFTWLEYYDVYNVTLSSSSTSQTSYWSRILLAASSPLPQTVVLRRVVVSPSVEASYKRRFHARLHTHITATRTRNLAFFIHLLCT